MYEMLKSKSKFYNAIKLANDSSSIQTSLVNAKGLSMVPAPAAKDSSIITAPNVKDSSIIPAPAVIDPSIIPAPIVIDPSIFLAPAVKNPSTIPAPAIDISTFDVKDLHMRAKHDAAKNAFIGFRENLKAEGRFLVREDLYFCKAIMNEYVVKINMSSPNYVTNESKTFLPIFVSSFQLNGVTFTGDAARNSSIIHAPAVIDPSIFPAPTVKDPSTTPAIVINISTFAVKDLHMRASLNFKCYLMAYVKLANDSSSIQTSLVNAKDSSRIQASTVTGLSMVPAPAAKDSSIINAPDVKDSSIIPAPIVIDSSIIPAPVVIYPTIFLAPAVKNPSTIHAHAINISTFAVKDLHMRANLNFKCYLMAYATLHQMHFCVEKWHSMMLPKTYSLASGKN
ncbi:hypothetical protein F511_13271 [Dorcoceras hygrometricum]|uniref:Uncharacterized protein n=1 Tax=Dorcoceras hygrometricum TaxID=472368 RepID=A0A2Z7AB00_9LAMI|nr:hypothetical protein F511_13271 [Dorcoceras hygrometricum]